MDARGISARDEAILRRRSVFAPSLPELPRRLRVSDSDRLLRATREDRVAGASLGINVYKHRLIAFAISGGVAGLAGGLLVHQLGSMTVDQVYLNLAFLTLAMLIIGGAESVWGSVVGAVLVSIVDSYLQTLESGAHVAFVFLKLPSGSGSLVFGLLMVAVIILKPTGVVSGSGTEAHPRWMAAFTRTSAVTDEAKPESDRDVALTTQLPSGPDSS